MTKCAHDSELEQTRIDSVITASRRLTRVRCITPVTVYSSLRCEELIARAHSQGKLTSRWTLQLAQQQICGPELFSYRCHITSPQIMLALQFSLSRASSTTTCWMKISWLQFLQKLDRCARKFALQLLETKFNTVKLSLAILRTDLGCLHIATGDTILIMFTKSECVTDKFLTLLIEELIESVHVANVKYATHKAYRHYSRSFRLIYLNSL